MADNRVKITLRCDECKQRNYNTVKNKKNTPIVLNAASIARSAESTPCMSRPSNFLKG